MIKLIRNIVMLSIVSLFIVGCSDKKEDINIGFVAGLSGKYSSLGISTRDGFLLAMSEINNNINGQTINIIQRDDKQNKQEAKKIIDEFIKKDINIIIGNATSSMTAVTFPVVNKHKNMLLFSATASSNDFTKQDDNFLRIQVEHSDKRYKALKDYLIKKHYKRIFFIYDSKNYKYAEGYEDFFRNMLVKNGGSGFVGRADIKEPYEDIKSKLLKAKYDMILIVGNSIDSANIIQYIRLNNIQEKILCSGWAKTIDFIANGGSAVEGVLFATGYDDNSKEKAFINLYQSLRKHTINSHQFLQHKVMNLVKF